MSPRDVFGKGNWIIPIVNFAHYVTEHAARSPEESAIVDTAGRVCSYQGLADEAGALARLLASCGVQRLGLLADRTIGAYVGVVASAWNGVAYVPFSLKAPPARLGEQLQAARCECVLVDGNGLQILTEALISRLPEHVVATDETVRQALAERGVRAHLVESGSCSPPPVRLTGKEEAHLIFTSGSSGAPKGVVVSTRARDSYAKAFCQRYPLTQADRVAQPCDLSWDMSLSNMVAAFVNGATLYLMGSRSVFAPTRFLLVNKITVWHSVPSIADMLLERGTLRDNLFPDLRLTLFAGAPLFARTARAWLSAAPRSLLVNSYGPTEMTVECLDYVVGQDFEGDDVPIGVAYPGTRTLLLREDGSVAQAGEAGELLLGGPQQADGYLDDPARTELAFTWRSDEAGTATRWYRTGDLVTRDEAGLYYFRGRLDHQVKVLGYRVELEEIEARLRQVIGLEQVVVSGYPFGSSAVDELVAFMVLPAARQEDLQPERLREELGRILPAYMMPHRFFVLEALPRTENGKLDRKALAGCMENTHEL